MSFIDGILRLFGLAKTKYNFPNAQRQQCEAALRMARDICKANGVSVKEDKGAVTVTFVPGTRSGRNGWAFRSELHGFDVMGYCDGGRSHQKITYAHKPGHPTEGFRIDGLAHEFCHAFLIRNEGIYHHDKRLHGKIFGWHGEADAYWLRGGK